MQSDIETEAPKALKTAHLFALRKIMEATADEVRKRRFTMVATELEKEIAAMGK